MTKHLVKVAEHSFSCILADVIQRRHKDCKKKNMPSNQRSFYLLNAQNFCATFLHN